MDAHTHWAIEQIQRYLTDGNAAAVVELGEHIIAHHDDELESFLLAAFCLAKACEQLEQWKRSLHWFEQCLVFDPDNPDFQAGRGRALLEIGQHREAAAAFRDLTRRFPHEAGYHATAGSALLRLADLDEAAFHLEKARSLNPTNPYVLNDLASTHLFAGNLEAALRTFKEAIAHVTPDDVELARDIHNSIEEVRATLVLQQPAVDRLKRAEIVNLHRDGTTVADAEETYETEPTEPTEATSSAGDKVRSLVREVMERKGYRPRQILAALHLWSDFLDSLSPAERAPAQRKAKSWAAAILYTIGRLDGVPQLIQTDVAKEFVISPSALSRRFTRLRRTLAIEVGDPRYATSESHRRAALLEDIHKRRAHSQQLLL